ncbi:MAG TPA: DNA-3-methyladenine glycosylase 2 family protein, partial [Pelagibacterales bacterium]|nr:DNA-3-methyladenine glycosylase 2 family protein [Pelagibacterales bacterium]
MKPKYWNKGKEFLSKKDKVLKSIIDTFPNEHLLLNTNYYHSLINSIIGQQISVGAASSVRKKFFTLSRNITPNNVLKIKDTSMKKCGLSRQKTLYIKNISHFFIYKKNFIKNITSFSEIEIINNLISIKGVGQWTAHMFLIFSIG